MNRGDEKVLAPVEENLPFLKRNLPDILTASRLIAGFIILSLSFVGKSAYLTVVILTLAGAATDILDGMAARRYLGKGHEGRLGSHDAEIDVIFFLCVLGYFTFSGIVINRVIGFGWIILVLVACALTRRDLKIIIPSEIISVIAMLVITLIYNPRIFGIVIVPVMAAGLIINRRRVLYLIFEYWPRLYSGKS